MFTLTDCDEYGYGYVVESFQTIEDALYAIERLKDALESATVHQSYAISAAIEGLKDQLANYQQSPD